VETFEGFQIGDPSLMQLVHLFDLQLKDLQITGSKKRLIATLKCCRCRQQLSPHLLLLFAKLGHAIIGTALKQHPQAGVIRNAAGPDPHPTLTAPPQPG
jgi:hypothetical protein